MNIRKMKNRLCAVALSLGVLLTGQANSRADSNPVEPRAGGWRTYVLTSGAEVQVPPPPDRSSAQTGTELAELAALQAQRTAETQAVIEFWDARPAFKPWVEKHLELIQARGVSPPRAHRQLALVQAAIYDAVVAAWHWKFTYRRQRPDRLDHSLSPSAEPGQAPSYPSEHAAVAGAASRVLAYLFEGDAEALRESAEEAAASRLHAGVNYRSDVEEGLELGRQVAELVISRRAMNDGSEAAWDCAGQTGRLTGPGHWEPTSPPPDLCTRTPTEPLAGGWRPWVIRSTDDFLAAPPEGFNLYGGDAAALCGLLEGPSRELMAHVSATRAEPAAGAPAERPRNELIARWAGVPGRRWNLITLELLARDGLNLPRAVRVSALVNAALADSINASWRSKYAYWTARPQTVIRQCGFDPAFTSVRPTPRDPSYTSGNATSGAVASEVLAFFFPRDAEELRAEAEAAGTSRLYDGTHWPLDVEAGAEVGRRMAALFLERAKQDGAHPAR
jgi:hypothetical protein